MDRAERERLVTGHLELPKKAARLIYPRVMGHIELDELVSLGNAGLAEAAARFDPDRGIAFGTYAWYRVQGAIFDGLRRSSNLPRRVWQRLVALRAASELLEQRAEADAGALRRGAKARRGVDALAEIKQALAAIRTVYVTSLEAMHEDGGEPATEPVSLEMKIDVSRLGRKLRRALDRLPEKERALVTKHYWEGKNLLEAGEELGISKSWASRLHAQAVERLRAVVDSA